MARNVRKVFYALVIVFVLVGVFGCATTASVGLGYHIPVAPGIGSGIYFGVGF